jgi:hypothetical protein
MPTPDASLKAGRRVGARAGGHLRRRRGGGADRGKPSASCRRRRRGDHRSTPTRSAPRSRTSSRTRARSLEPAGALAWRARRIRAAHRGARQDAGGDRLAARTPTSTACVSSPSAPRSASSARRCSTVTIPEKPGSFRRSATCSARAQRSPSSTTATPMPPGADLRRRAGAPRARPRIAARELREALRGDGPHRQRDGQAARALHGRRARTAGRPRSSTASSFPERPGALLNFLNRMEHDWNISLFHYRNHGSDYGRVLVGMPGAARRPEGLRRLPAAPRLRLRGRDRQPGLPHVPVRELRRRGRARRRIARDVVQARGLATPFSVTSQSIGWSCSCGSVLATRPISNPTPTAIVRMPARVRSK